MIIYVSDDTGRLFGGVYLWKCEVEEKAKTYKVLKSWTYVGNDEFAESRSLYLLTFYPKQDKRVFTNFEDARNKSIDTLEKFIKDQEENIVKNKEKLAVWKT